MRELQKIPVPWEQRWRAIRYRTVPIVVFLLAAAVTAYLWNRQLTVTQIVGEVHAGKVDVAVQYDGILLEEPYHTWKLYDRVEKDDVLAQLDEGPTLALIATVRAELEQAKGELAAAQEEFYTTLDDREFERSSEARRLANEVETRRLAIADRKALLIAAEMELKRQQERYNVVEQAQRKSKSGPLISDIDAIEIQRLRDVAQETVRGHKGYIAQAERELKFAVERLGQQTPTVKADINRVLDPLRGTIAYQQARIDELEVLRKALVIRAPISGLIVPTTLTNNAPNQPILAIPGQQVRAGTVLFTIAAEKPEYIVSYVRPSQRLRPTVGMAVAVRPTNTNQIYHSLVDKIGPQVELIPPHQLRDQRVMEWGLPVRIPVPATLNVRPGELVNLKFIPEGQSAPPPDDSVVKRG
jgi:multidrug resistance efflux pump